MKSIRPAIQSDLNQIVKLGLNFHKASGLEAVFPFDPKSLRRTLRHMVESPSAGIVVIETDGAIKGAAGFQASKSFFNETIKVGQERFFWIEPDLRGFDGIKLLHALEQEAKVCGCTRFAMVSLNNLKPEQLDKFYRRQGYEPLEHVYVKLLSGQGSPETDAEPPE